MDKFTEGDISHLLKKSGYDKCEVYVNKQTYFDGQFKSQTVVLDVGGTLIELASVSVGSLINKLTEVQNQINDTHHTPNEIPYSLKWLMRERKRCMQMERYEDIEALTELISLVKSKNRKN